MIRHLRWAATGIVCLVGYVAPAAAQSLHAAMAQATAEGPGASVGTIAITQTASGASFALGLRGLPPGPHGFHVHENGQCGPTMLNGTRIPAGAAGSHLDPEHTAQHAGPEGAGHLGDLPLVMVAADGTATGTLTAPHIKDIAALKGRALVIHVGGDNYADQPLPLGGGGARLACGVIGE